MINIGSNMSVSAQIGGGILPAAILTIGAIAIAPIITPLMKEGQTKIFKKINTLLKEEEKKEEV